MPFHALEMPQLLRRCSSYKSIGATASTFFPLIQEQISDASLFELKRIIVEE
jgi:hypothetical protein